jgi:hypothetical protein
VSVDLKDVPPVAPGGRLAGESGPVNADLVCRAYFTLHAFPGNGGSPGNRIAVSVGVKRMKGLVLFRSAFKR